MQWHDFQRDAKQILAAIHSKRATLRGSLIGTTVQEVRKGCELSATGLRVSEDARSLLVERLNKKKRREKRGIVGANWMI